MGVSSRVLVASFVSFSTVTSTTHEGKHNNVSIIVEKDSSVVVGRIQCVAAAQGRSSVDASPPSVRLARNIHVEDVTIHSVPSTIVVIIVITRVGDG
ncbi:hypothetical protein BDR26DRAFT_858674 [Obelidium mucronatum]|nr:hypothetical protein BDR26DRAFT_858674 [Obelidium mucronatum]